MKAGPGEMTEKQCLGTVYTYLSPHSVASRQRWEQRTQVSAIIFWEPGSYCFGYRETWAKYQGFGTEGGRKEGGPDTSGR